MRTLIIKRPWSFIGCVIPMKVNIDGMVETKLGSGKTVTLQIDEKEHKVQVVTSDDSGGYVGNPTKYSNVVHISSGSDNVNLVAEAGGFFSSHKLRLE